MRLGSDTYYDAGEVSVQHSAVFVVTSVYLQEVGPEVLHDGLVIIGPFAEGCDAKHIFRMDTLRTHHRIRTISELLTPCQAWTAGDQFCLKNVRQNHNQYDSFGGMTKRRTEEKHQVNAL